MWIDVQLDQRQGAHPVTALLPAREFTVSVAAARTVTHSRLWPSQPTSSASTRPAGCAETSLPLHNTLLGTD